MHTFPSCYYFKAALKQPSTEIVIAACKYDFHSFDKAVMSHSTWRKTLKWSLCCNCNQLDVCTQLTSMKVLLSSCGK